MGKYNYKKNAQRAGFKRYIHTQTRKAITATAGVGAIIESLSGAFKVADLDKWWFFQRDNLNNFIDDNGKHIFEIKEDRLKNRLLGTGRFPKLQRIIHVPPNAQDEYDRLKPAKEKQVGRVEYFPTWFFCETCEQFKPIAEWWHGWLDVLKNDEGVKDSDRIRGKFFYDRKSSARPNCYCCYKDALEGKRKFHKLEQVRFVFVSPEGDVKDIEWPRWITAKRLGYEDAENTDGMEQGRYLLGTSPCCENPSLRYIRSTKLSDLTGITIECENCKSKKTLAGFFNLREKKRAGGDSKYTYYYKPLIRTSNSIYYPIIMNSLFIPQPESKLSYSDEVTIRNAHSRGLTQEEIAVSLKYDLKDVKQVLGGGVYLNEMEFRKNEYNYLLNEYQYLLEADTIKQDDKDLILEEVKLSDRLKNFGFDKIIKVKRLKLTSVQTGYTRLYPMDSDTFSVNDNEEKMVRFDNQDIPLKPKCTVTNPHETEFLAGVESFGEGIFIKWDDARIKSFVTAFLKKEKSKVDMLFNRVQRNEMIDNKKFKNNKHLVKMLLIHSFSHLIIKELEFLCGYQSASFSERIYCDQDKMHGLLIYTIAGSEGSFGGLIQQAESNKFYKILTSALWRAKDCASDPICYESEGQGIGGLNYAACYSCLLISETSCEEFNSFLDRKILLDSQCGFFRQIGSQT